MSDNEDFTNVFSKTLSSLMAENPRTGQRTKQLELAQYLGVTKQAISVYCTGKGLPVYSQLIKIAEYFDVSIDYLLLGKRYENKNIRKSLNLSEESIENLECIASNKDNISYYVDRILKEKEFYSVLEKTVNLFAINGMTTLEMKAINKKFPELRMSEKVLENLCELGEYQAAKSITDFFMEFFKRQNLGRGEFVPDGDNVEKS